MQNIKICLYRWNNRGKSDAAFRIIYDLQAEKLRWSNGYNSTVFGWYIWILWKSSITFILQRKRAIMMGECVRGSFSYPFTFPLTSTTMPNMAADIFVRWETEILYTVATRLPSLFNRKQDTTCEQLLISEENNKRIRIPKPWAVLEDSLLTMM